ncbi:MAG: agmatine deiminase family protein [Proteobacteria bacterium]|nr:agmatine deiminase family protein [Pseudomonadota bacterium]
MTAPAVRFPAEWEPQSAVVLAWPHAGTDWATRLASVETSYVALVGAITRFQTALVCVPDAQVRERATHLLAGADVPAARLRFVEVEYDDTWLRDSGPISLCDPHGFRLLDFRFNAWGDKYASARDDRLIENLFARGVFAHAHRERVDFALEGGAIETDGDGTLLCHWHCLHTRHPDLDRSELSTRLAETLHQRRVLWIEHGALDGDDTDAHIDTLARFAAPDAIVHQACDDADDPHYGPLAAMERELAALHRMDGRPYRLFPLPWPRPIHDDDGRRLAASYANFLIVDGAVLMPAYDDPADAVAAAVLARAFPDRQVVPVPCRPLIWQNGSLHCLTMQLPRGLLAA